MHNIKRITDRAVTLAVIIVVSVALLFGAFTFSIRSARAETRKDITEFTPTSLDLGNANFTDSSGSYPAVPNSWTGEAVGNGKGSVVSGVIDLTAANYVKDNGEDDTYKLDQYDEYKTEIPRTIFGGADYPHTDAKALLINTARGASASYAYTSSEMTFLPNAYYRVSAWVKTGDFVSDTGATIKLSGLGQSCSFININTVKAIEKKDGIPVLTKENNYGWVKYTFYVRTSASLTKTVNLVLGIGDAVSDSDEDPDVMPKPAHGYAFFDTVTAEQISAYDFAFDTSDFTAEDGKDNVYTDAQNTAVALDLFDTEYLSVKDDDGSTVREIGTFSDRAAFDEKWNKNARYGDDSDDYVYLGASSVSLYDSHARITPDDNDYGFTQNPWAPLGRAESDIVGNGMFPADNGNILLISTYNSNSKTFDSAARGIASPDFVIERFKYYRFGVWVKGDTVNGGNGISVGIKGEINDSSSDKKLDKWYTELDGAEEDKSHYGWKEKIVYIKGSVLSDLTVHFELWLGAPDAKSSGIAMFDNVTFTEVTYTQFTKMSEADSGDVLSLDASGEDTGVDNGNFMAVGDYTEFKYPLPVAEWTYKTTDTVSTNGFSNSKVDTDKVVYGLIPTDSETFDSIDTVLMSGVVNPATFAGAPLYNALIISSTEKTAACYQSPSITVATDKAYKITTALAVSGVSQGSYGASLVLKNTDGSVLSTIENITTTRNAFKTYTFYIDAPLSDQTVHVEIWLGLNDRDNNTHKLSDGTVYVKEVALVEWTADGDDDANISDEYAAMRDKYLADTSNPAILKSLDYGVYSYNAPTLDYYDAYTYNMQNGLGTLYSWNVLNANSNSVSGIFNTDNMKDLSVYDGFDKKDRSGNMLLIHNTQPNRTSYDYGNSIALVSNMYYRLDVTVKVRLTEEMRKNNKAIGAGISLTGTVTETFENIKDTTTLVSKNNEESRDYETFKTYTFFISTGNDGGSIGLGISFGGEDRTGYIEGQLIIADISFTSIGNSTYDKAEANLDEAYQKAVKLSETSEENNDNTTEATKNDIAWWIIPTVIFSACLLAAIILVIVMRIREHVKRKKKTTYSSDYDRTDTIKQIENLQKQKDKAAKDAQKADAKDSEADDDALATDDNEAESADGDSAEAENDEDANPKNTQKPEAQSPAEPKDSKSDSADDLDD